MKKSRWLLIITPACRLARETRIHGCACVENFGRCHHFSVQVITVTGTLVTFNGLSPYDTLYLIKARIHLYDGMYMVTYMSALIG
jgi:hypothetical protein